MPFDFLATQAAAAAHDYRRRPDGSVDIDHYRALARAGQARAIGQALNRIGAALVGVLAVWCASRERARQRRLLLSMDDRMLRDIGISRCDAMQGVRRAVFRP